MRGSLSGLCTRSSIVVLSVLALSCAGDGGDPPAGGSTTTTSLGGGSASLTVIQNSIFTPTCAFGGCHDAFTAAESLNLSTADDSFNELVGVASTCGSAVRVVPGNPGASYLLDKLGAGAAPCGDVMPLGFAALSDADIDLIRNWIQAGAPAPLVTFATAATTSTSTTSTVPPRIRRRGGQGRIR